VIFYTLIISVRGVRCDYSPQTPKKLTTQIYLDGWLTMHRSITLVDFQLDAQNSYLFTYNKR